MTRRNGPDKPLHPLHARGAATEAMYPPLVPASFVGAGQKYPRRYFRRAEAPWSSGEITSSHRPTVTPEPLRPADPRRAHPPPIASRRASPLERLHEQRPHLRDMAVDRLHPPPLRRHRRGAPPPPPPPPRRPTPRPPARRRGPSPTRRP